MDCLLKLLSCRLKFLKHLNIGYRGRIQKLAHIKDMPELLEINIDQPGPRVDEVFKQKVSLLSP